MGEYVEKVFEKIMDYSPSVRAASIKALGKMGEKGMFYAGAVAQRLMAEEEAEPVQVAAIEALGNMGDHGAVYADVVSEYLQNPLASFRAAAVASLGKMGSEAEIYVGSVKALRNDPDSE